MNKKPKVAIVTPIFNGKEHTRKFLSSLNRQSNNKFSTIIVDDGSTDGSDLMIKDKFPDVIVLKGDGSLWWSGGTNKGVEYAIKHGFDYVLTINNDVEVSEDYIDSLVAAAKKKPKSLIGSTVYYRDDPKRVWYFGASFGKNGEMQHFTEQPKLNELRKSEWLTGMGVIIPIQAFKDAGLYDEKNFPQYFGDAEFSLRAKRAGYELYVNSKTKLFADVTSSWVSKQIQKPKISFFKDVFFSIRSPYQFKTRVLFYKLYWPKRYRLALMRLYFVTLLGLYASYFISIVKNILGVKRFRDIFS